MKNLVVSLEVAKKLIFYLPEGFVTHFAWINDNLVCAENNFINGELGYSAPLLGELLELLPETINGFRLSLDRLDYIKLESRHDGWVSKRTLRLNGEISPTPFLKRRKLTPDRVAELYMWLVDNKYVEVER